MKLATTTGDFGNYCKTHKEMLKCVYEAGFRYADLSLYDLDIKNGNPFMEDGWKEYTCDLAEYAKELGITFVQAHSPGMRGNVLDHNEHYDYFLDATIRSIEICSLLGIKNTVFHTGFMEGVSKKDYFKENADFIRKLIPTMEKSGVTLCIENSTKVNMGTKYFFLEGCEMNEFIDYVGHPLLKACWDVGHANLEGHNYKDIVDMKNNLVALHIHDNFNFDSHQMPFTGNINMDEVMQALVEIDYKGYFTMEAGWTFTPGRVRKNPRDNERLRDIPLELMLEAEKLLFKVGKWILQSYDCYEE